MRVDPSGGLASRRPAGALTLSAHGPSFVGDGAAALSALADDYDRRLGDQLLTAGLRVAA